MTSRPQIAPPRALALAALLLMAQAEAPKPVAPDPAAPDPAAPVSAPAQPAPTQPALPTEAPAKPPAEPPAKPPAENEYIYHGEAASILGRVVHGPADKTFGRIVDVLVDDAGQPRAAVIDVGGFMGMGTRRIAVAWRALAFAANEGKGRIMVSMTLDQIKGTPDFKPAPTASSPPVAVAVPPPPAAGTPQ